MTDYIYRATVFCDDETIGGQMAAIIDPLPDGALTFTKAAKAYPAGTTFSGSGIIKTPSQPHVMRGVSPVMTANGHAMLAEFNSAGPYPLLNAAGVSDAVIAAFKPHFRIASGLRTEYTETLQEAAARNGMVMP
jgi:hypothetical protein